MMLNALVMNRVQELGPELDKVRNYVTKQMNLIHKTATHGIGYPFGTIVRLTQAQAVATSSLNLPLSFSPN